ncbi:NAD(P)H-dependent oxidoreductase [Patescibacteria group bacterium]|nr:NAD(P)H-dependent oxidoreductase [Patescibacteria group bacterium]MCL5114509.1 NAD(P)H-dependent oxidoreductase [Patescibacteria group bacterium]
MNDKIKIVGISGSLRKESFHTKLLKAAAGMKFEDAEVEIVDIGGLPLFNQDWEMDMPEAVKEFKKKIKESDAVLFVTPEYNYSVSGALKNAIDCGSRPYGESAWSGKPAAIISGSVGMLGGSRAQYHLRQMMVFLDMHPLNKPEVMVSMIQDKFDAGGNLTDEATKAKVKEMIEALVAWTRKLG